MSILKKPGGTTRRQRSRVKSASKGFKGTTKKQKSRVKSASKGFKGTTKKQKKIAKSASKPAKGQTRKQKSVINKFKSGAQKRQSSKRLAMTGNVPKLGKKMPKGMKR